MRYNTQKTDKRIREGFLWLPKTMWTNLLSGTKQTRWLENAKWIEDNDGEGWLTMYWHSEALERYFRAFGDFGPKNLVG